MRGTKLILALAILSTALPARADWPSFFVQDLEAHQADASFQNGYAYTVWAAAQYRTSRWMMFPAWADRTVERAPDPELKSAGMPVAVHLARDRKGRLRRAPLLIFFLGMFGNVTDPLCSSQMELYSQMGYHIVAFANPWSTSYRASQPVSSAGAMSAEGAALLRLLGWAKDRVGRQWITRTDLLGISYGAFLAPIVLRADSVSPRPEIDGYVMSFSPPADIARTMRRLDEQIAGLSSGDNPECARKEYSPLFMLEFVFAGNDSHVAERYLDCTRAVVVQGFKSWITTLVNRLGKPELAREWAKNPGYHRYLELFAPEVEEELDVPGAGNLAHRIHALPSAVAERYGVVSAFDDFLNAPEIWGEASIPQLVLLQKGGHAGYLSAPWFIELRKKLYSSFEKSGTPTN